MDETTRGGVSAAAVAGFERSRTHVQTHPWVVEAAARAKKVEMWAATQQAVRGDRPAVATRSEAAAGLEAEKARAWERMRGVSREEAMRTYVKVVEELDPGFRVDADVPPPPPPPSSNNQDPQTNDEDDKHSGVSLNLDASALDETVLNAEPAPEEEEDLMSHHSSDFDEDDESFNEDDFPETDAHPTPITDLDRPVDETVSLWRALSHDAPRAVLYWLYDLIVVRVLGLTHMRPRGATGRAVAATEQSTAVLLLFSIFPMTVVAYLWTFVLLLFPLTTLPTASYLVWALYLDDSPRTGKRKPWLRSLDVGQKYVDYFPIKLRRASVEPLDPTRNYVFVYAPHGVAALGAWGAFATDGAGFPQLFPGIDLRLLTLPQNFRIPIVREFLLGCGMASCSRKSCDALLRRGPGASICLVAGGAKEAIEAEAGQYRLVLRRKGFVRVAVDANADLVPVLAFGENDAFYTLSAHKLGQSFRKMQSYVERFMGFTIPLFWGRLLFMPRRVPINVVTGDPIRVEDFRAKGLAGEELVDAVHAAYVAAVKRLFAEARGMSDTPVVGELEEVDAVAVGGGASTSSARGSAPERQLSTAGMVQGSLPALLGGIRIASSDSLFLGSSSSSSAVTSKTSSASPPPHHVKPGFETVGGIAEPGESGGGDPDGESDLAALAESLD